MRWTKLSRRTRRRLRFEPLEDRRLMADLRIGVTLVGSMNDNPNDTRIDVGKVGDPFTLEIRVQDVRDIGQQARGVIALPLHISWDPNVIELLENQIPVTMPPGATPIPIPPTNPLLTDSFPLQRFLTDFDAIARPADPVPPPTPDEFLPFANLQSLRGAALPNAGFGVAIGVAGEEVFSTLSFKAIKATNAPDESLFTVRLAGSMSFADASVLDEVVRGSNTAVIDAITVQARLQVDAPPIMISGTKFNDLDNDGARDASEPGLGNWTIRLIRDQNLNGAIDPTDPVITTTTAADGSYQFTVTDAGTYFVREVQQAGWVQTTLNPAPITPMGMDVAGVDFGNCNDCLQGNSSLSGFVFADTNLNGKFDIGEDGLPNVAVQLRRTDVGGSAPLTTLTGPDGWYHFENLASGMYDVIEVQPAGFVNASISRGLVFPAGSVLPSDSDRGTTDGFNAFRGINLRRGANAVDYNFGDNIVPTKRRFVASVDPFAETCSLLGLNCVTVRGTGGNDQIEFAPDTDVVRVTVNNQPAQVFSRDTVNIVKIDALAGDDTVTLLGSSADEVAHFQSSSCTIQTGSYRPGDYAVLVVNAERTIADGGLGNDLAVLRDSVVDDVLTVTNDPFIGPIAELESVLNMTRFVRAIAFERTRAVSIPNRGSDTATLNGLPVELVGDWSIID